MNDAPPTAEQPPAGPPGPAAAPPPLPPLRRSRRQKVIAGVCGGLGRQWDLDPVIFRIVLAVLSVAGGLGLIVYGFAWLLIPLDGEDENEGRRLLSGRVEGQALTALLFALVGCGLFLTTLGKGSVLSFAIMLTLAVAGSAYWSRRRRQVQAEGPESMDAATKQAVADAPPETKAPPAPQGPSWWRDGGIKEATAALGYLWGPEDTRLTVFYEGGAHGADRAAGTGGPGPGGASTTGPGWPAVPAGAPPVPRRSPRTGRSIGGRTFLLAVLAGTGTALAVASHSPFALSLQAGLAVALAVFGLGLALSAWLGRTGGGTVCMVVLTALLLTGAAALPDNVSATWQHRTWAPGGVAALQPRYELGSGEGVLRLDKLSLPEGRTVRTSAEVGVGRIEVTLPRDTAVTLRLSLGVGDIRLPGEAADDVDIVAGGHERTVRLPAEGTAKGERPRGTLELDLRVGAGQVDVRRASAETATPGTATATGTTAATTTATDATAADASIGTGLAPRTVPAAAPVPQGARP